MSRTSPHLEAAAAAVADGAHVILHGHVGDEVLVRGRITSERAALAELVRRQAGCELVLVVDAADGLKPLDAEETNDVERLLAAAPAERDAIGAPAPLALGNGAPIDVTRAVRTLMRQRERACVVLFEDIDLILDTGQEAGRRALGLLRAAMREAQCVRRPGDVPPRNVIVVCAPAGAPELQEAGVRSVHAAPPDRDLRLAALEQLSAGFHQSQKLPAAGCVSALHALSAGLPGSLRELEQVRRGSHHLGAELGRPGALIADTLRRRASAPAIETLNVNAFEARLRADVVGQGAAIDGLVRRVAAGRWTNPLRPPGERLGPPRAAVLLPGPPGVGKTETARATQRALSGNAGDYLRIDCGELQSSHDVARLVGAPPGYIGHESGGALTDELERQPARVVLFDEVDKADPAFYPLLLSLLEEGRLTDGRNRTANLSQAVVMLTCNLGDKQIAELLTAEDGPPPTHQLLADITEIAREALCESPELQGVGRPLWSRIAGDVLPYDILRREAVPELARRQARLLETNLSDDHRVELTIDNDSLATLLDERLPPDGRWDGRKVNVLVRESLVGPLRVELASRSSGGRLHVRLQRDGCVRVEPAGSQFARSAA